MELSHHEEVFLRHWMYEELHYQDGRRPAKHLQLEHHVLSAELALLIAAAIPEPADQGAAGDGPRPAEPAVWPWPKEEWQARLSEARDILAERESQVHYPRP